MSGAGSQLGGKSQERVCQSNLSELSQARPEAQPYTWDELGDEQRRVICNIHQWMAKYVAKPPIKLPAQGPFTWQAADLQRPSNVLLIHGGRGSGKTSVMLTLLELWRLPLMDRLLLQVDESLQEGARDRKAQDEESQKQEDLLEAGRLLDEIADTNSTKKLIIPLKPLDLQPLPRSTSLLTWIASRIREFAELLERSDGGARGARSIQEPRPIASWHPEAGNEEPWRKSWQSFANAIAYGWESNLKQRRGSLDPEAYAEELTEAERSRHDVVVKWRQFVSEVVSYAARRFRHSIDKHARLVLPIDDVDMNPHRCVEVLDLVRFLWHPQLVFLLTGQSRLFVKMLSLNQHGIMREEISSDQLSVREFQALDARPSAHELAVQAYDKVVPPSQRFALGSIPPAQRLARLKRLTGEVCKKLKEEEEKKKREDEEKGRETPGASRKNERALEDLLERLTRRTFLQYGLPPYYRRLRNLEQLLLRAHVEDKPQSELVYLLWDEALKNMTLSRASDQGLKDVVRWLYEPAQGLYEPPQKDGEVPWKRKLHVTVDAPIESRIRRKLTYTHLISLPARDGGAHEHELVDFEISQTSGFVWRTGRGAQREVSEQLTALLLLAIEVAHERGEVLEGAYKMNGLVAPQVRVLIPVQLGKATLTFPFHWPTVDWLGSEAVSRFSQAWEKKFEWLEQQLAKQAGPDASFLKDLRDTFLESLRSAFTATREEEEAKDFKAWEGERKVLLAAPESGLPREAARHLMEEWRGVRQGQDSTLLARQLRRMRLMRARLALAQGPRSPLSPAGLLKAIDRRFCGTDDWVGQAFGVREEPPPEDKGGREVSP